MIKPSRSKAPLDRILPTQWELCQDITTSGIREGTAQMRTPRQIAGVEVELACRGELRLNN
jgi:hypothetical protein